MEHIVFLNEQAFRRLRAFNKYVTYRIKNNREESNKTQHQML